MTNELPPPCQPAEKMNVWRCRSAVFDGAVLREATEGPFVWVGYCRCGQTSQAGTPEAAQAATADACSLATRAKMHRPKVFKVMCAVCRVQYPGMWSACQGVGCAAVYSDGVICGDYGSSFDTRELRLTGPGEAKVTLFVPTYLNPICDTCIEGWVKSGHAVDIEEYLIT